MAPLTVLYANFGKEGDPRTWEETIDKLYHMVLHMCWAELPAGMPRHRIGTEVAPK